MADQIDETWGPFRVRLWNNLHLPPSHGDWWAMVTTDEGTLIKLSGPTRSVVIAAVRGGLNAAASERGLRLKPWRGK
tara:strand:- start:1868 stop:2098 length:231 start_codon:yes stop_codon:yes gene_type:complete